MDGALVIALLVGLAIGSGIVVRQNKLTRLAAQRINDAHNKHQRRVRSPGKKRPERSQKSKSWKRTLKRLTISIPILLLAGFAYLVWQRPAQTDWKAIYQGVDYYCGSFEESDKLFMVVRLDLDTPGLDVSVRPSSDDANEFRLAIPEWQVLSEDLSVLMNATLFEPGDILKNYPGSRVRSLETLVTGGRVSHRDPHSYLVGIDETNTPFIETTKPPSDAALARAVTAVSIQGVQLHDGEITNAATFNDERFSRTFIGITPSERQLFLVAAEDCTSQELLETCVALGIESGGMLDSDDSTTLMIGRHALDISPLTAIRGRRLLGPAIYVRAESLEHQ